MLLYPLSIIKCLFLKKLVNLLASSPLYAGFCIPWNTVFSSLLWYVWKRRNNWVFQQDRQALDSLLHQALSWANIFSSGASVVSARSIATEISWEHSSLGFVYLNTDGSVGHSNYSSSGGILRCHDGGFIAGFDHNLGTSTVINSELWGILDGLNLAWDRVRGILTLIRQDWQAEFKLIKREASMAPDFLTRLARDVVDDFLIFDNAPRGLHEILDQDVIGPPISDFVNLPCISLGSFLFGKKKKKHIEALLNVKNSFLDVVSLINNSLEKVYSWWRFCVFHGSGNCFIKANTQAATSSTLI
ncbi:hypothetical protein F3Y22_tig00001478pilonHSYRG00251 [Hibiscus syriacus]|uniref:RNase H type-1 domain-containing protein n=1 Tax=Hibiscus syriacus TaxID=106335 RepID=A0A6A3CVM7_HIBSY|nr:hypothetical protein F3Y22_tig00001478pilonHSYRG00251 [Hibiscus syriacus]